MSGATPKTGGRTSGIPRYSGDGAGGAGQNPRTSAPGSNALQTPTQQQRSSILDRNPSPDRSFPQVRSLAPGMLLNAIKDLLTVCVYVTTTQADESIDLLESDASEELLELELRATTPVDSRKPSVAGQDAQEHIVQDYERQLAVVHQQVDRLQAQMMQQAEMGEQLQASGHAHNSKMHASTWYGHVSMWTMQCTKHGTQSNCITCPSMQGELRAQLSTMRGHLVSVEQEAADAEEAAGAASSQLQAATRALQQLQSAVSQLVQQGSAGAGSLSALQEEIMDASSSVAAATEQVDCVSAKHTAIQFACEQAASSPTRSQPGADAQIAR
jgi:chromosome segregation ATPase